MTGARGARWALGQDHLHLVRGAKWALGPGHLNLLRGEGLQNPKAEARVLAATRSLEVILAHLLLHVLLLESAVLFLAGGCITSNDELQANWSTGFHWITYETAAASVTAGAQQ